MPLPEDFFGPSDEAVAHAAILRTMLDQDYAQPEGGPPCFTLERAALKAGIDALQGGAARA